MENSVSDLHIKSELHINEEEDNEEMCYPTILASKIYCITKELQATDGEESNSYMCVPKDEYQHEIGIEINGPQYEENSEELFQKLFREKEKMLSSRNRETQAVERVQQVFAQNKILLCPFCAQEFTNISLWRHHLNYIHSFNKPQIHNMEIINDNKAKCKECNCVVSSKTFKSLQQHKIKHLPHNRYVKCKLCLGCFLNETKYKQHVVQAHDIQSSIEDEDASDIIISQSGAILLCPFCGIEFKRSVEWRIHLKNKHNFYNRENLNIEYLTANRAKCKECQLTFSSRFTISLQRHKITHLPYNRYFKCQLCDVRSYTEQSHKRHFSTYHNCDDSTDSKDIVPYEANTIFMCPCCAVEFPNIYAWRYHLNEEHKMNKLENLNMEIIGDKSKCKQCGMVLSTQNFAHLQRHRIKHLPYKRYFKCRLCTKEYARSESLTFHFLNAHNIKEFI